MKICYQCRRSCWASAAPTHNEVLCHSIQHTWWVIFATGQSIQEITLRLSLLLKAVANRFLLQAVAMQGLHQPVKDPCVPDIKQHLTDWSAIIGVWVVWFQTECIPEPTPSLTTEDNEASTRLNLFITEVRQEDGRQCYVSASISWHVRLRHHPADLVRQYLRGFSSSDANGNSEIWNHRQSDCRLGSFSDAYRCV